MLLWHLKCPNTILHPCFSPPVLFLTHVLSSGIRQKYEAKGKSLIHLFLLKCTESPDCTHLLGDWSMFGIVLRKTFSFSVFASFATLASQTSFKWTDRVSVPENFWNGFLASFWTASLVDTSSSPANLYWRWMRICQHENVKFNKKTKNRSEATAFGFKMKPFYRDWVATYQLETVLLKKPVIRYEATDIRPLHMVYEASAFFSWELSRILRQISSLFLQSSICIWLFFPSLDCFCLKCSFLFKTKWCFSISPRKIKKKQSCFFHTKTKKS